MRETEPETETADECESGSSAGSDLDLDTTFHLLQTERRRLALRYLLERERAGESVVEMRDLAEQVAAWEHDTTVATLESDQRQRVYVGLYQTHLPKLDQHDVIDYEQSRGRIELQPECRALEPYLERPADVNGPGPPENHGRSDDDGEAAGELASIQGVPLLIAAVGLVPLAVLAARVGPDVVVSTALLGVVLLLAGVVGGGLHQYVGGRSIP